MWKWPSWPLAAGRWKPALARPFELSASAFFASQRHVLPIFDALDVGPGLQRVRPHERLVNDERCLVYAHEKVLYSDDDHLSISGARFIAPLFDEVLRFD